MPGKAMFVNWPIISVLQEILYIIRKLNVSFDSSFVFNSTCPSWFILPLSGNEPATFGLPKHVNHMLSNIWPHNYAFTKHDSENEARFKNGAITFHCQCCLEPM